MVARRMLFALLAISATAVPALGQTTANIGANFTTNTAATVVAAGGSEVVPPDTMGAIGPNYWVSFTNGGEISMWNKAGTKVLDVKDSTFWQMKVGLGSGVAPAGDARIIFDPLSGRWFATVFTDPTANNGINNKILIARSDTANPTGSWKGVVLSTSDNLFHDYPTLGVDKNGVYIGTNNFNSSGNNTGETFYSIPKSDLLSSTPTLSELSSFTNPNSGQAGLTLHGANNFNLGQTTSTSEVFLGTGGASSWRSTPISGTSTAGATLGQTSSVNITAYSSPPAALQPNAAGTAVSSTTLDSLGTRETGSALRVGNLVYFMHGTTLNSRAALQLTVFDYSNDAQGGSAPKLEAETILGEPGFDYYLGTVAANANGTIVVGFTRSGFVSSGSPSNQYPSSYALVGNLSGSTISFGSPIQLMAGVQQYTSFQGSGVNRWGDYSATQVDPADPGIFWTIQEYAGAASDGVGGNTNYALRTSEIIPTIAGEVRWQTAASGNFTDTTQWFNGVVPGATDHAIFSRNGDGVTNFTVTFPGNGTTTTNARASVRQGVVTFNIPTGSTYSLMQTGTSTPSLAIAEYLGTANLTVSGGGTLSTVNATIAAGVNSEGPAALVTGGVAVVGNTSVGSMTVSGTGTLWHNSGNVYLSGSDTAAGGMGSLSVVNSAMVTIDGQLMIWRDNGVTAMVTVGGSGNTGTLIVGQLNNASGTAPVINLANSGSLLQVGSSINSSFSGIISGSGAIQKLGSGTFALGNVNTFTGGTTLSAGLLQLGATNALPSGGTVNFNGGTLSTGASAGFSDVVGTLQLSSSSTLALGTGSHSITFSGIGASPTGVLTITGWNGTPGQVGTSPGQVLFTGIGSTPNLTFAAFLSTVQFSGFAGTPAGFVLVSGTTYELLPLPVPEPAAILGIAFGVLGFGTVVARRLRGKTQTSQLDMTIAS
jgi:autotransporter-associated beta strand protein